MTSSAHPDDPHKPASKRRSTMHNVSREIHELREQVQSLADIVKKSIKNAEKVNANNDNIFDHLNGAELSEAARKAGKDVRGFIDEKYHQAEEVYADVEGNITKHPFQAMAMAVSAGALLGMLMHRK
jgi:ElaB/YqjD/DUF883 family membrane-anchored ribosome-binding protein